MRRRPSTPSRSCSTIVSKRTRPRAATALCLAALSLLVLAPARSRAQAIELSVAPRGGLLTASRSFRWARTEEVIDSLRKGLESRITFTLRLYEKRRPAFSFAGDRLLSERTVVRSAFWDFLDQVFVVEGEDGAQKTYTDPAELLRGFFALDEVFGFDMAAAARRRVYVSARAQFEPVRLMPPLTLIGLAGAAANVTTPWVRRDAP
jgi:hypothetical protein